MMLPLFLFSEHKCLEDVNIELFNSTIYIEFEWECDVFDEPLYIELTLFEGTKSIGKYIQSPDNKHFMLMMRCGDFLINEDDCIKLFNLLRKRKNARAVLQVNEVIVTTEIELEADFSVWEIVLIAGAVIVGIIIISGIVCSIFCCCRASHKQPQPEAQLIYIPDPTQPQIPP